MAKKPQEWLKQADFDLDTAKFMITGARYFYAVFMCHLAVEKALKGLYQERLKQTPPKVHNLVYLLNKIEIKPPEEIGRFLIKLNEANLVTRYPEDIDKLQKDYTESIAGEIISGSEEVLVWIKAQF